VVYYLHGDHLGSTSLTTDQSGAVVAETRYLPYGQERWTSGATPTDFTFTGQRNEAGFGLMDYNARYYSPVLGRFISPDTIVPNPANPQKFNRYAYAYNNPVRYNDPSGHCGDCLLDAAFITYDVYAIQQEGWTPLNTAALVVDVVLVFVPIATGGGPGLRLAFAGGETLSKAAAHIPAEVGALQGAIKFSQLVDKSSSGSGSGGTGRNPLDPANGNTVLSKQEKVNRSDGSEITDFDSIEKTSDGDIWLIEEKSATWAGKPTSWAQEQIFEKGEKYIEAIKNGTNLPTSSKNIGFRFSEEIFQKELQTAVENAVQQLQKKHSDYNFELFIPK
jgi:RHS repeat-associated protein